MSVDSVTIPIAVLRALNDLGKYYGISGYGNNVTNSDLTEENKRSSGIDGIFHNGTTYPAISAISIPDEKDFGRVIITTWKANSLDQVDAAGDTTEQTDTETENNCRNRGIESGFGQGWRKPAGDFSALWEDNCVPSQLKEYEDKAAASGEAYQSANPVHVIQSFDPTDSPSANGADISTILLNGIPTLEWSRCVPYFDLVLKHHAADKTTGGTDLTFTLAGDIPGRMGSATFETEKAGSAGGSSILGAMEMFTAPQTMQRNPVGSAYLGHNAFAPLASVESFSTTMGGIMPKGQANKVSGNSFQTFKCSLRLRLHDKSRLNVLLPLVTVGGQSILEVTFGWSHPDSFKIHRPADAQNISSFGALLAACRTTESFIVKQARYSFVEGGEVQIDLELTPTAQDDLIINAPIAAGGTSRGTDISRDLDEAIDFVEMMRGTLGASTKMNLGTTFIESLKSEMGVSEDFKNKVKKFKSELKKQGYDGSTSRSTFTHESVPVPWAGASSVMAPAMETFVSTEHIKTTLKRKTFAQFGPLAELFEDALKSKNTKALKQSAAKSNAKKIVTALLNEVSKGHDPFLRPKPAFLTSTPASSYSLNQFNQKKSSTSGSNNFISFGKLVTFFASAVLSKHDGLLESQIIFYPFNADAAGMWNHNIAQFPLPKADLVKALTAKVKKEGMIPLRDLFQFVITTYINDDTFSHCHAYGLTGLGDEKKSKRLRALYGDDVTQEKLSPGLKAPDVQIRVSSKPARMSNREPQLPTTTGSKISQQICRIEIYDVNCSTNELINDVKATKSGAILKKIRKEKRDGYLGTSGKPSLAGQNRHSVYYEATVEKLKSAGVLEDTADVPADTLKKTLADINKSAKTSIGQADFDKIFQSYYFVTNDVSKIKSSKDVKDVFAVDAVRSAMRSESAGYIIYGAEGTSVTDATVQNMNSSKETDARLSDMRDEDQLKEDSRKGLGRIPKMIHPAQVDITCLGNPFITVGQNYYCDFGTNTNVDGVYIVNEVSHNIEPGKFETKVRLRDPMSGGKYTTPFNTLFEFVVGEIKSVNPSE